MNAVFLRYSISQLDGAFWTPSPPRVNLIALGLAAWCLAELLARTPYAR